MVAAMGWPRSGLPPDRLLRAFGRAVVSVLTTKDRVAAEGRLPFMVLRCVAEGAIGVRLAGPSTQPDKFPHVHRNRFDS